jgi:hypothetical protein
MERPEGVLQGIAEDHEVRLLYSQLLIFTRLSVRWSNSGP